MSDNIEYGTTGKPHPYHIVRPSIWPLVASLSAGILAMGAVLFMHKAEWNGFPIGAKGLILGLAGVLAVMFFWWKDIIFETTHEKVHNKITEVGMRFGMSLFIASEVMFFVAFFWAFFNGAFFPTEAIGWTWPPQGTHTIDAFGLPFLMTLLLLLSGCTVTWAHHAVVEGNNKETIQALGLSVLIGAIFLGFQVYEYSHLVHIGMGFSDNIYTSAFFMATGFHGFHVLVGAIFLFICWQRAQKGHFTPEKHFGFEAAAWYWHFVDVVWLFLFIAVYWWGNAFGMDLTEAHGAVAAATGGGGH